MKAKKQILLKGIKRAGLFLIALTLLIGCSGDAGPQGEQGQQGPVGPQGEVGVAGADGSVIYSGDGAPNANVGVQGDFYLDKTTQQLYGPKIDASTWGSPIMMKGADGQDGEDGSKILSGTTAPDASLGVDGDFYFNKTDYELYGPKSGSSWGTATKLRATSEVRHTPWFKFKDSSPSSDTYYTFPNRDVTTTNDYPILTGSFIDKGGYVLVYVKKITIDASFPNYDIYSIPFNNSFEMKYDNQKSYFNIGYSIDYNSVVLVGSPNTRIDITLSNEGGPDYSTDKNFIDRCLNPKPASEDPKSGGYELLFKIIFVPNPGATELSAKAGKGALDFSDYEVAKKYFEIKD